MYERTHIDLFTGLGGFSLAARANGVRTVAMCESYPRCQAFLAKAWPGVPVWPDVRSFSMADAESEYREGSNPIRNGRGKPKSEIRNGSCEFENVWLLTAGVPCQPASRAGKQRGKEDDRWLWPAAVSVFAAIRPAWGLFENPPGIGDVGLAGILSDLGREGYATRVFSLGACALGAPHRRMRYWIICRKLVDDADVQGPARPNVREGRGEENGLHPEHPESESGGMGDTECLGSGGGRGQAGESAWPCAGDDRPMPWGNCVWLPCADGKVRRAPSDAFLLAHGLRTDLLAELEQTHRSALGALGNSIVWPVATRIISAMIRSEE